MVTIVKSPADVFSDGPYAPLSRDDHASALIILRSQDVSCRGLAVGRVQDSHAVSHFIILREVSPRAGSTAFSG